MKNHSYYQLREQSRYCAFAVKHSETGLYLSNREKRAQNASIFDHPEYGLFELQDIHVTILEHYEALHHHFETKYKRNSPFHITLRLQHPENQDIIVIHDFYSAIDLSRDFHIQLHHAIDNSITYLPQQIIKLRDLDLLIQKEINLVKELIDKNNAHEQKLFTSVDDTYEQLFSIATQANHFPEVMEQNDYQHFIESLNKIIRDLEELVFLGHRQEKRRLANSRLELQRWTRLATETETQSLSNESQSSTETKNTTSAKKKTSSKSKKLVKAPFNAFLNDYYNAAKAIKDKKNEFLEMVRSLLLPKKSFNPQAFYDYCRAHHDIFSELLYDESEMITLSFFGQFSICRNPIEQTICVEIARFLSECIPHFSKHMIKQSMNNYEIFGFRISAILMAFLNKNLPYWEYMKQYGMCFSDNRHIIYDGIAGNILQGMLILINAIPKENLDSLIPFVQCLFRFLDETNSSLSNMKTIQVLVTQDKKRISAQSFFKKQTNKQSNESKIALEVFKKEMLVEPFGTIVMMDAIELWLMRARKNWALDIPMDEQTIILMPKLVDLMVEICPKVRTETILNAFQRLLALQPLGMFDDHSCHPLLGNFELPSLALLSHFDLIYIGEEFKEPVIKLLNFFIDIITERGISMSNSSLSKLMQSYFAEADAYVVPKMNSAKLIAQDEKISIDEHSEIIIKINMKLTYARIAYLLFTIKVKRGMYLNLDDYRVMLQFYQCYLATELSRFEKTDPDYAHQKRVCMHLMEASNKAIDNLSIPEDIRLALTRTPEYIGLMSAYQQLKSESEESQAKSARGLVNSK